MAATKTRISTSYHPKMISEDRATNLYNFLARKISWTAGVKSVQGFTRFAYSMGALYDEMLDTETANSLYDIMSGTLKTLGISPDMCLGAYLNWYKDGSHWTPNHSHKDRQQVIISLGATRRFELSKKSYNLGNGDVIVFGSGIHGIPKDPTVRTGRISIAMFLAISNQVRSPSNLGYSPSKSQTPNQGQNYASPTAAYSPYMPQTPNQGQNYASPTAAYSPYMPQTPQQVGPNPPQNNSNTNPQTAKQIPLTLPAISVQTPYSSPQQSQSQTPYYSQQQV